MLPALKPAVADQPRSETENPPSVGPKQTPTDTETQKPPEAEKAPEPKRPPWYSIHEQGTIVTMKHNEFTSPYVGPFSLLPKEPSATTETATLFFDTKLWSGADLVFNPEISGGTGFSGTSGIAGFPNGEATRVGVVQPTPYVARLFLRQVWGFEGESEKVEDDANQIAGVRDVNRLTFMIGKLSAEDVVDNNLYSHDPRTQLLNWSLMYNGAWDYPANVRGYTYGFAFDFNTYYWAWRYGIFAEPAFANGAPIDPHWLKANGQVMELEERYWLGDLPGHVRELVYLNHAHMGNYGEALAESPVNPDVAATRVYRFKYGWGLSWDQQLTPELGAWGRLGWNDGHTESWAFTPIDRTAALGLLLRGKLWHRTDDTIGLAGVINGLDGAHRHYLAAGGLDFNIGDGRLNYAPEEIFEAFYNWQLLKGINVSLDTQFVNHPAYNADRGPVFIWGMRVHFEH